MENAKYGLCFASGLGATMGFLGAFEAGDHIIYTNDLYGGTNRFFKKIATRFGITSTSVDATKAELVEAAIQKNTKVRNFFRIAQLLFLIATETVCTFLNFGICWINEKVLLFRRFG